MTRRRHAKPKPNKERLAAERASARRRKLAFQERREAKLAQIAGRPRASACELCGDPGKTVFDHCHTGGHFRGWLCHRCNVALGLARDNVEVLRRMIDYLERNR